MPSKIRSNPTIPDHEVLRKIGGGAYGEVWLARGVTGALRAVKVVWREDFEDARGFEREFEGILKFEPMSRDHPALVNILHVGRSPDGVEFYYYVMELGDDVATGQEINPIEYEPRTLRADSHQGAGVQWDTSECIDVGLRLAEALNHLHERGLAHRDVKPSNVIFVNGRAKLADIGLVAARGQRTFVGTEGFVPPEGPGSSQADIYSLGKVLYEIATGKDRMSFPELPEIMPTGADGKRWLELNKIICDICEPRISKRKISNASELADALGRLQRGKRRRQTGLAVWTTTFILTAFVVWAGRELLKDTQWQLSPQIKKTPALPQMGMLRVVSAPEGAEVRDANGKLVGTTNTGLIPVRVGDEFLFSMNKRGFRPYIIKGIVPQTVVTEPLVISASLENFSPPQVGDKWDDHLGNPYQPVDQKHVSSGFILKDSWTQYADFKKRPTDVVEFLKISQNGKPVEVALVSAAEAKKFCAWFEESGYKAGFLTEDHEIQPQMEASFENPGLSERARRDRLKPFRVVVTQINYAQISISTEPPGVEIYINPLSDMNNQGSVGSTNETLVIPRIKPGAWQLYLVREGYKPQTIDVTLKPGEKLERRVIMEQSTGVVFGKAWENSIRMKYIPLGEELMVSIWETRVSDYELYAKEVGLFGPRLPTFPQGPDHPVVNVTRDDAQAFCTWLTERERKNERIAQTHVYRLPTDLEWSMMVGLREEEGISPGWRDARKQNIFPWGPNWLEGEIVGNFADVTALEATGVAAEYTIPNYDDGYPQTSPVGAYPANSLGLFDLSGNAQEWVGDEYSKVGNSQLGVLRGGGWSSYKPENLYAGSRNAVPPTFQDAMYGFRVVLAKVLLKDQ